jgi:hypothetical protein
LSPPLAAAPEDLWQCPRCQERLAAGVRLHSHALEEAAKARAESGAGDVLRHRLVDSSAWHNHLLFSVTLMLTALVCAAYRTLVCSSSLCVRQCQSIQLVCACVSNSSSSCSSKLHTCWLRVLQAVVMPQHYCGITTATAQHTQLLLLLCC